MNWTASHLRRRWTERIVVRIIINNELSDLGIYFWKIMNETNLNCFRPLPIDFHFKGSKS